MAILDPRLSVQNQSDGNDSQAESENNIYETPNEPSSFKKAKDYVFEIFKIVAISLLIIVPIRMYVVQPFIVEGDSMLPNFHDGEYLIVDEISYRFNNPQRGDVVIFHPPNKPNTYYIKRIIGLPGEKIATKNGEIYIYNDQYPNGLELNESSYLIQNNIRQKIELSLDENQYFVIGDNRDNSLDSRHFGPIGMPNIKGKAFIRAFPFNNLTIFKSPEYVS